ncbi:MAG: Ribonuclease Y [candidate division WS2 bacterium]|uniref:Ribonuclease Y n=1 Tax=Psychracetigena formicireducens TaxID=2986056 RepID=A0A9E2BIL0_PSYF1|nr:Ribonuclease Y [Candidatus Psychracetigena formicireducens]
MISRDEAENLLKEKVKNKNMVKHCLAVEAVMKGLARTLNQDETAWGLTGLLHDIDLDIVGGDMNTHSLESGKIMRELGFSEELVQAVEAHNEAHGLPRDSIVAKALYAADPVTGLIVAAALVHPDRKISSLDLDFILRRFNEKWFAKGADREQIKSIILLGISFEDFLSLSLKEMSGISGTLGL